jgi:hypothetical protein
MKEILPFRFDRQGGNIELSDGKLFVYWKVCCGLQCITRESSLRKAIERAIGQHVMQTIARGNGTAQELDSCLAWSNALIDSQTV